MIASTLGEMTSKGGWLGRAVTGGLVAAAVAGGTGLAAAQAASPSPSAVPTPGGLPTVTPSPTATPTPTRSPTSAPKATATSTPRPAAPRVVATSAHPAAPPPAATAAPTVAAPSDVPSVVDTSQLGLVATPGGQLPTASPTASASSVATVRTARATIVDRFTSLVNTVLAAAVALGLAGAAGLYLTRKRT